MGLAERRRGIAGVQIQVRELWVRLLWVRSMDGFDLSYVQVGMAPRMRRWDKMSLSRRVRSRGMVVDQMWGADVKFRMKMGKATVKNSS